MNLRTELLDFISFRHDASIEPLEKLTEKVRSNL